MSGIVIEHPVAVGNVPCTVTVAPPRSAPAAIRGEVIVGLDSPVSGSGAACWRSALATFWAVAVIVAVPPLTEQICPANKPRHSPFP